MENAYWVKRREKLTGKRRIIFQKPPTIRIKAAMTDRIRVTDRMYRWCRWEITQK